MMYIMFMQLVKNSTTEHSKPGQCLLRASQKHASVPLGSAECFRYVADTDFTSWRQKLTLETTAFRVAKLETLWKHALEGSTTVSENVFPRFAGY